MKGKARKHTHVFTNYPSAKERRGEERRGGRLRRRREEGVGRREEGGGRREEGGAMRGEGGESNECCLVCFLFAVSLYLFHYYYYYYHILFIISPLTFKRTSQDGLCQTGRGRGGGG